VPAAEAALWRVLPEAVLSERGILIGVRCGSRNAGAKV